MMTTMSPIRPARIVEAELLSELGIRSKAIWNYSDKAMVTFREELIITAEQIETGTVFVATSDNRFVGYYTLVEIDKDAVELQHLFIDPAHLNRGYGSRLLNHALETARKNGFHKLVIQSDPNAAGFYDKHHIPLVKQIPSSIPGRSIPWFEMVLQQ